MNENLWKNKYWQKAGAFCLSLGLLLAPLSTAVLATGQKTESQTQVSELNKNKAEIEQKKQEVSQAIARKKVELEQKKAEVQRLKRKSDSIQAELAHLEAKAEAVEAEKKRVEDQLAYAKETLEQRLQEKEAALAILEKQQAAYQERLAVMFYYRQRSWWEVLLDSKGLAGFFTNIRMVRAISSADKELLDELKRSKEVAAKAEETAAETMAAYEELLNDKNTQIEALQQGITDTKESRKELSRVLLQRGSEEEDLQKTLAEQMSAQQKYEANSRELAEKIAKIEQQNQVRVPTPTVTTAPIPAANPNAEAGPVVTVVAPPAPAPVSGGFVRPVWPLPGFSEIWSPFGYRNTSFDAGNGYVHTGTDIAGPNAAGAPVVAAWSGVVVAAEAPAQGQMFSPNANYVSINHGGGLGSAYWHLLDVTVSVGQVVQAGQVIGHCGSTGMSTGPHLHFEVYDKNNPNRSVRDTVDPMSFFR